MAGHTFVIAAVLMATGSCLLAAGESRVCLNDTIPGDGEGDGEYASLVLIGKYKVPKSEKPACESVDKKMYELAEEQLKFQQEQLERCQNLLDSKSKAENFYRDCEDAYERGARASGVYTIQPDDDLPFQVYCDMNTDGGGWTVFQRRKDGSVDFYRDWMDYTRGFGNLTGEFWLGLRKIHRITAISSTAGGNELRVDLEDFEDKLAYAKYRSFAIGDSASEFILSVSRYSGTAGDSLAYHNGYGFATKDQDNDSLDSGNCAQMYKGGWWYRNCHESNLNGLYLGGQHTSYADGVEWYYWKEFNYSLKSVEMKVRRK